MICLTDSLSVQDLLNVGSASAREGFRRTAPRLEKRARPCRELAGAGIAIPDSGRRFHGTDASGPSSDIRISMLASPQGASVLNMWIETFERIAYGGHGAVLCRVVADGL